MTPRREIAKIEIGTELAIVEAIDPAVAVMSNIQREYDRWRDLIDLVPGVAIAMARSKHNNHHHEEQDPVIKAVGAMVLDDLSKKEIVTTHDLQERLSGRQERDMVGFAIDTGVMNYLLSFRSGNEYKIDGRVRIEIIKNGVVYQKLKYTQDIISSKPPEKVDLQVGEFLDGRVRTVHSCPEVGGELKLGNYCWDKEKLTGLVGKTGARVLITPLPSKKGINAKLKT